MIRIDALACGPAESTLTCAVAQGACVLLSAPLAQASLWFSAIAGLTPPRSGHIHLAGDDVTLRPLERRRLAFRASAAMPVLPVAVGEYLTLAGAGRHGTRGAAADLARISGLGLTQRVNALEAAALQTLGLAAAVAAGAPILLVDRPLATGTGDDHARRRALLTEARHSGRTLLVSGLGMRDALVDHVVEAGA